MTQKPDNQWSAYYAAGSGRAPRPLLVDALARFAANPPDALPRLAVIWVVGMAQRHWRYYNKSGLCYCDDLLSLYKPHDRL